MLEGKVCSKCFEYKLLSEYYKAKDKAMGVKCACKQCAKPIKQNHYQNNKEKYRIAYLSFLSRNPNYCSIYQGK